MSKTYLVLVENERLDDNPTDWYIEVSSDEHLEDYVALHPSGALAILDRDETVYVYAPGAWHAFQASELPVGPDDG